MMKDTTNENRRSRKASGFTLVEMTLVLVIIGLLVSSLIPPLSAQIDQRNLNETREQLAEIREALIGFAVVNGRLPRPATSSDDGNEKSADCNSDADCTGFIPWTTLGLKRVDAWNKMIRYSVTPSYSKGGTLLSMTDYATKKILMRNDEGAVRYLIGDDDHACSEDYRCSPAVIFSHGKNNWGTTVDGAALADTSATNTDVDTNAAADKVFFSRDPSTVPTGGEFDDIVTWIPPYILFNRMIAAGKLP